MRIIQTEGGKLRTHNLDMRTFENKTSYRLISVLPTGKNLLNTAFNGNSQSVAVDIFDHLGQSERGQENKEEVQTRSGLT